MTNKLQSVSKLLSRFALASCRTEEEFTFQLAFIIITLPAMLKFQGHDNMFKILAITLYAAVSCSATQ
jgi:hypothetical protein